MLNPRLGSIRQGQRLLLAINEHRTLALLLSLLLAGLRVVAQNPRKWVPILGGLALILAVVMTSSVMVIGMIAAAIIGIAALVWIGGIRVLYAYAALIWLLPRIYLPGLEALVPLHVLIVGGLAFLWCVKLLTEGTLRPGALLPPFWPLVAVYAVSGMVAFMTGRSDIDAVNGLKFTMEACVVAPLLYLVVWHFMRDPKDAERLVLLISLSALALGAIAFIFQGSAYWTPIPFEKEALRLSGQYQFGGLYLIVTPVLMSTQLSMLIPALTSLVINSVSKWRRTWAGALLVPLTLIILLAAGRSGWMGCAVGVGVVLFFSARAGKVSLPRVGAALAVCGCLGLVVVTSMGLVNDEIIRRIFSFSTLLEDDTVVFRYWIWGLGLDLIGHYPFGVGFQVILGLYGYPAHNQYILWALGTGVPGFVAVVGLLLAWIVRVIKTLLKQYEPVLAMALGSLGAVIGAMIGINGDNISTSVGWTQGTLWIMLGIGAAAYAKVQVQSQKSVGAVREPPLQSPKSSLGISDSR